MVGGAELPELQGRPPLRHPPSSCWPRRRGQQHRRSAVLRKAAEPKTCLSRDLRNVFSCWRMSECSYVPVPVLLTAAKLLLAALSPDALLPWQQPVLCRTHREWCEAPDATTQGGKVAFRLCKHDLKEGVHQNGTSYVEHTHTSPGCLHPGRTQSYSVHAH